LGGLGDKQGPYVEQTCAKARVALPFIPFAGLLGLMALGRNRTPSAWWVWLAVAGGLGVSAIFRSVFTSMGSMDSQALDLFAQSINALTVGLGAVWLTAGYLGWRNRFLAFLGMLGVLVGVTMPSLVLNQEMLSLSSLVDAAQAAQLILLSGFGALMLSVALFIAGLLCRGTYHWLRLTLRTAVSALATSALLFGPVLIIALFTSGGNLPILQFFGPYFLIAGLLFALLLPFVALSLACPFYRERLKDLLHLRRPGIPPVVEQPRSAVAMAVAAPVTE
jgi:hypothetical protein